VTDLDGLVPVNIAGYRGKLIMDYDISQFRDWLAAILRKQFSPQLAVAVSQDRAVYQLNYADEVIFVKYYRFVGLKAGLKSLFQVNKAQKSWRIGCYLMTRRVPTPRPIAYLTRRVSWFEREEILVTQGIVEICQLRAYIKNNLGPDKIGSQSKRQLIQAMANFLSQVHQAGVYHGDFTSANILIRPGSDRQGYEIYLIDLDAVRTTRGISYRRRVKNLHELQRKFLKLEAVSCFDRARFLRHYCRQTGIDKKAGRRLSVDVFLRSQKRLSPISDDLGAKALNHRTRPSG
jgi:hypothetical protein